MLSTSLLARSLGDLPPRVLRQEQCTRLLHAIQPAPNVCFDGSPRPDTPHRGGASHIPSLDLASHPTSFDGHRVAHEAGVNALAVDRFEDRYLLTGGADASISIWDLDAAPFDHGRQLIQHSPLASVPKSASSHKYGVTSLSFYPFDSMAFLSSSYDHTLKLYSSETMSSSVTFSLDCVIYSHSISPIARHLLVACATQHPAVRLVDLRSGANTHSLAGHGGGAVLSVAWSPKHEFILASGGTDGSVRFWDVRRGAASLGALDMDDSIGVAEHDDRGTLTTRRERGKAHADLVNGIVWTENAKHVVTSGHDERIRIWDTVTGANTLANFGPVIKNRNLSTLLPALASRDLVRPGQDVLFFPNEREILMYEMFEGQLLKRLKPPAVRGYEQSEKRSQRNIVNRTTALCWRPHNIELLSAHTDGTVKSWRPRTSIDAMIEDSEQNEDDGGDQEANSRKRKRQMLKDIHNDVTKQRVTFI